MTTATSIQKRISNVLRQLTGLEVISEDVQEGFDMKRPSFLLSVNVTGGTYMKNWAENDADVFIYYYGHNHADCQKMHDRLNQAFNLPLKIDDIVVQIDEHESAIDEYNILEYQFSFHYIEPIDYSPIDIVMGNIPHITDENTELIGEVISNGNTFVKEKEETKNGSN